MRNTVFDLLFVVPPPAFGPGIRVYISLKSAWRPDVRLPEGQEVPLCVGLEAQSAKELKMNVAALTAELGRVVHEAKRRETLYHDELVQRVGSK